MGVGHGLQMAGPLVTQTPHWARAGQKGPACGQHGAGTPPSWDV